MNSLADVFRVLGRMREERIVLDYAIGGAMAVLFYAEPTRRYKPVARGVVSGRGSSCNPERSLANGSERS